jgi:hypothetical protein
MESQPLKSPPPRFSKGGRSGDFWNYLIVKINFLAWIVAELGSYLSVYDIFSPDVIRVYPRPDKFFGCGSAALCPPRLNSFPM